MISTLQAYFHSQMQHFNVDLNERLLKCPPIPLNSLTIFLFLLGWPIFLPVNKELTTSAVLEENNGHILKNLIIPTLVKKHKEHLKEISVTLASNFNISYNKYQLIVINQKGSRFSKICGHLIFTKQRQCISEN